MKTCPRCGVTKPLGAFHRSPGGVHGWCADCKNSYQREKYKPESGLAQSLRRYGLTVGDFNALLAAQGGVCAICREQCASGRRLSVDHDHVTGRIRGLLCHHCNTGLGKFRDSPLLLAAAVNYLMEIT